MLVIKIWTQMLPWLETLNTYKLLSWLNGQIFTFSVNRVVIFGLLSEQRVYCQQQLLFPIFQVSSSYFESLPKNIWTPIKRLLEQHLVSMIISSSICQLFLVTKCIKCISAENAATGSFSFSQQQEINDHVSCFLTAGNYNQK